MAIAISIVTSTEAGAPGVLQIAPNQQPNWRLRSTTLFHISGMADQQSINTTSNKSHIRLQASANASCGGAVLKESTFMGGEDGKDFSVALGA